MYYEIRRYQIQPGRREEWVRYMEDVIIPFQTAQGMDVTASFVDDEDEDGYVWMRRFKDEADSDALRGLNRSSQHRVPESIVDAR
ncbi:antibiotic biosynthesis monooxygenase [Streptomyces sp. NPDC057565]|uniref:antibiotic biosynthesis monooxygenase n=1 Tax=Streptomyces sp. NPDC057565 TaxID=3346169 RepID=UPI003675B665